MNTMILKYMCNAFEHRRTMHIMIYIALTEHPECVSAKYWSSRRCIAVSRICDLSKKEFRLKSLKRTRAMAASQDTETSLVNLIDAAKLCAFQFLEEAPGGILFNL